MTYVIVFPAKIMGIANTSKYGAEMFQPLPVRLDANANSYFIKHVLSKRIFLNDSVIDDLAFHRIYYNIQSFARNVHRSRFKDKYVIIRDADSNSSYMLTLDDRSVRPFAAGKVRPFVDVNKFVMDRLIHKELPVLARKFETQDHADVFIRPYIHHILMMQPSTFIVSKIYIANLLNPSIIRWKNEMVVVWKSGWSGDTHCCDVSMAIIIYVLIP